MLGEFQIPLSERSVFTKFNEQFDTEYPRRVLYMEIKGRQDIPLTRTGDNVNLREIEQKAAESAR